MKQLFLLLCLLIGTLHAHAHKPSDSYLTLQASGSIVEGRWDISLRDIDFAIGLDANGDAQITWGEVRAKHGEIAAYSMSRLALSSGGRKCPTSVSEHLIDEHTDGTYAVMRFTAQCGAPIETLGVRYGLFFDIDPQHKGLLRLQYEGATRSAIFTPDKAMQELVLGRPDKLRQFIDFCAEGVWHIWIGFDHILFLLALLLPAVLYRENKRWNAVHAFAPAFWSVLKIVTAFTVAHSITLSLATLGVVSLPSRLVEATIAASVVIAALNNLFPLFSERRWAMAFLFGLIHGFGFASVLSDLGLPQDALLLSLIGFNVGVEVGQLAIVAVFLPLAFLLRRGVLYREGVLTGGSLLIAALALAWFVERAFDLDFMPF